jgi:protein SCO1/2
MRAALLTLAVAAWSVTATAADAGAFRGGVFIPARAAPEFVLPASDGTEFRLSRYRSRVVAIGFGYSFCPDVCPTTLATLAEMRRRLGAAATRVQVVYVTVDPERDSLDRLRVYTMAFDPSFLGLAGSPAQLASVRKAYGITAERRPVPGSSGYVIHHSSFVYLVDPAGRLRVTLPFGMSAEDMAHDVALLLQASAAR